jgi:hypothetical protein
MRNIQNCSLPPAFPTGRGFDIGHGKGLLPNQWDAALRQDTAVWYTISCCGGIKDLCRRPGTPKYPDDEQPWVQMPAQGKRFQEIQTVLLANFVLNTDLAVVTFQVPIGYDGVINATTNHFLGLGFAEGSGDIEWRIQLSRRYAPDYGLILTTLGDLTSPAGFAGNGIRVYSNEVIRYLARITNFATLDPAGRVLCALSGWFYPRS